jgi:hypothetical protein
VTLAALADTADLADRNIQIPSGMDADTILDSASWSIRTAAGCPITQDTSTVTLVADDPCWLELPGGPVTEVTSLTVGSTVLTGWRKVGNAVRIPHSAWPSGTCWPVEITAVYTHGYALIPPDIVDLTCSLASMAFSEDGSYGTSGGTASSSIHLGDYSEKETQLPGRSPSPVALPDATRQQLRDRFGTSVAVVPF